MDFNIADAIVAKGSAPALTDDFYVHTGAKMTAEQSFSCRQIFLGTTSGGAAGAGDRWGLLSALTAGTTITFAGAASEVSSGIRSNPTSADASSLNCEVTIQGAAGSLVTLTNDGDAADTAKRWSIQMPFGAMTNCKYGFFKYMGRDGLELYPNTTRANNDSLLEFCEFTGIASNDELVTLLPGLVVDRDVSFVRCKYIMEVGIALFELLRHATGIMNTGRVHWDFEVENATGIATRGFQMDSFNTVADGTSGFSVATLQGTDIRPTKTIPTGLVLTDDASGETLRATITNIASYTDEDRLNFHNNSGDGVLASCTKAEYVAATPQKPANSCMIPGLTDDTLFTVYAKASSDGFVVSDASATATGTPTGATTPASPDITGVTPTSADVTGVVSSCKVYSRPEGTGGNAWTLQDTLVANGTATLAGLGPGRYDIMAQNSQAGSLSVPDVAPLSVPSSAAAKSALNPLQAAIYELLTGDTTLMDRVTGVFDEVPENQAFPYVALGEAISTSWRTHGRHGENVLETLHVWSQSPGTKESLDIVDDLNRLLADVVGLTVGDFEFVGSWYESATPLREPDGETRHVVVRYRMRVQIVL